MKAQTFNNPNPFQPTSCRRNIIAFNCPFFWGTSYGITKEALVIIPSVLAFYCDSIRLNIAFFNAFLLARNTQRADQRLESTPCQLAPFCSAFFLAETYMAFNHTLRLKRTFLIQPLRINDAFL